MNKTDQIRIKIQPELKEKFREYCNSQYKEMSEVIRDFIIDKIKNNVDNTEYHI